MFKELLKDIGWGLFCAIGFLGALALIVGAIHSFVSAAIDIVFKLF